MGSGAPRWQADEVCKVCKKRRTRALHPDECFGLSLFVGYHPKTMKWLERNRYRCIEPGVRDAVRTLERAGIRTVWSCDGAGFPVPVPKHWRTERKGIPCVVCVGPEIDWYHAQRLVGGRVAGATHTPRLFKPLLPKGTFYIWWPKRRSA